MRNSYGRHAGDESAAMDGVLETLGVELESGHHVSAVSEGDRPRPAEIWYITASGLLQASVSAGPSGVSLQAQVHPWPQVRGLHVAADSSLTEYPMLRVDLDQPKLHVGAKERRSGLRGVEDNPEWVFARSLLGHAGDIGP
jgi:hypothetical protein